MRGRLPLIAAVLIVSSCHRGPTASAQYVAELAKHDAKRKANLTGDHGWLTLAGLFWLKPGKNSVGSAPKSDVVLPASAPAAVGSLTVESDHVFYLAASDDVATTVDGQKISQAELASDAGGKDATTVTIGAVDFFVIDRNGKRGIRVRDRDSAARKAFQGFERFSADERYRVTAKLVPFAAPKQIEITNIIGMVSHESSPGTLDFELDGQKTQLTPVIEEGETELFVVFGDKTNGVESYGSGRFLHPKKTTSGDGYVLDFNLAENPPCAVTRFATCPLPPKENRLALRVEAGEKAPKEHPQ